MRLITEITRSWSTAVRQAAEKRSKRREQQTKREEEAKRKKAKEQTLQKKIQENEAEADGEESESSSEEDNGFISLVDKKIPIHNKQINKKKKQGKKVKNLKVVALNSMVPFGEEAMSKVVAAFQKDTMNQNKHRIPTFLMASQKKTVLYIDIPLAPTFTHRKYQQKTGTIDDVRDGPSGGVTQIGWVWSRQNQKLEEGEEAAGEEEGAA